VLVQIRDRAALAALPIVSLRTYLHSRGWIDVGAWGERQVSVFTREHAGRTWEILVPHKDTIGGYAENMAESVAILAAVEDRSQIEVYYDLEATRADMIRVRSANGAAKESLSLRRSAKLLNDAYDLLASAARAAERPEVTYRGKLSSDVADYLDNVRPLPGYHEGYNLTLHSPVPAGFGTQEDFGDHYYAPFPRRATLKLADALEHSSIAISQAVTDETLEPFERAVPFGVSANLCDSVAELAKNGEGIEIGLFWADVRPSAAPNPVFQFSENSAEILTEVARVFRQREPALNESVIGNVVRLDREPEEFDGRATILYVRDKHPIRLQVQFEQPSYNDVIQAFQQREPISVDGDIYRIGNTYELRNPRNLSLVIEETG
jgi:hypothetical protein